MSKSIIIAGATREEARKIIRGALRGAALPHKEGFSVPKKTPGEVWQPPENTAAMLHAIVIEPIAQTPNPTSEPEDYLFGKIRILGKDYKPKNDGEEPKYDDCACLDLANSEQLLKGFQVEVQGPFLRDNPDYDPELDLPQLEKIEFYIAIESVRRYIGVLSSNITATTTSTISVQSGGEAATFTVHGRKIPYNMQITSGQSVEVQRVQSDAGVILDIYLGPCPVGIS